MEDGKMPIQTGIKGVSAFAMLLSPKIFRYIKLEREVNNTHITIDHLPCSIIAYDETSKLDKTGIKKEASKCIREFESTLKREGLYLGNLYRNMSPYCVEAIDDDDKTPGYDPKTKKISVINGDVRSTIFSSLLECASSTSRETFSCRTEISGFHRVRYLRDSSGSLQKEYDIGEGLNRAYKELLLERYFMYLGAETKNYDLLRNLALIIEMLVGQNQMENFFLTGDLSKLIQRLPFSYEGVRILRLMDYINASVYENSGALAREKAGTYYNDALISLSKMAVYDFRGRNIYNTDLEDKLLDDLKLLNSILTRDYVVYGGTGRIIGVSDEERTNLNEELHTSAKKNIIKKYCRLAPIYCAGNQYSQSPKRKDH